MTKRKQHGKRRLVGSRGHDFSDHRGRIEIRRAVGHYAKVSRPRGFRQCARRVGRQVDDGQFKFVGFGDGDHAGEATGPIEAAALGLIAVDHRRLVIWALLVPSEGGLFRVTVDDAVATARSVARAARWRHMVVC